MTHLFPPSGPTNLDLNPLTFLYPLFSTVTPIRLHSSLPLPTTPDVPSLDDKLFSFWHLQADAYPYSHVKGIYRFETGIKVNEFRDLRANPRCLVESQILSFRVRWSRMLGTGVLGSASQRRVNVTSSPASSSGTTSALGIPFDPYDHTPLPSRIISTGAAANFPSVSNLVGDVFNAPVYVPNTQVDSAQVIPHRNAPVTGFPGRAALGGSYVARWVWGREWASGGSSSSSGGSGGRGLGVFEDEMRRLLQKRWVATGGVPLRTHIGPLPAGSGANSGTSTPFGPRSGVGATVFEEEEEDLLDRGPVSPLSANPNNGFVETGHSTSLYDPATGRLRTQTGSTIDTLSSSTSSLHSGSISTAYTTPDLGSNNLGGAGGSSGPSGTAGTATSNPTPLTPVVALPTADGEAQIGLAKVAEPDSDAFSTYAAIVPEYCRLEGMLVKGIV
ncbi:hypothetical protein AN958_07440 [Leucoagaricus sp. SymC.cos]|nr:hypothetical protein AN958_07440 [Leucoagaricus sp. SymC.cos]